MEHDKKGPPSPPAPPPPPEPSITITLSALEALIDAKVQAKTVQQIADVFTAKTHDEQIKERMDKQRGKDRPLPPEEMIPCVSPITGADLTARVVFSKQYPAGRIVEILDYKRPPGWDKHVSQGGLYHGEIRWMKSNDGDTNTESLDKGQHKYRFWIYSHFWQRDWNILSGKPASFLAQWRKSSPPADKAAE